MALSIAELCLEKPLAKRDGPLGVPGDLVLMIVVLLEDVLEAAFGENAVEAFAKGEALAGEGRGCARGSNAASFEVLMSTGSVRLLLFSLGFSASVLPPFTVLFARPLT